MELYPWKRIVFFVKFHLERIGENKCRISDESCYILAVMNIVELNTNKRTITMEQRNVQSSEFPTALDQ